MFVLKCPPVPLGHLGRKRLIRVLQAPVRIADRREVARIARDDDRDALVEPCRDGTDNGPPATEPTMKLDMGKFMRRDDGIDTMGRESKSEVEKRSGARRATADTAIAIFAAANQDPRILLGPVVKHAHAAARFGEYIGNMDAGFRGHVPFDIDIFFQTLETETPRAGDRAGHRKGKNHAYRAQHEHQGGNDDDDPTW